MKIGRSSFATSSLFCCAILASAGSARADERPTTNGDGGQTTPSSHVAVESDREGTRLVRFEFLGSGMRGGYYHVDPICTAPCATDVERAGSFRVIGPGITPSPTFELPPYRDVTVRVHAGSWGANATGMVLSILGAAYVPVGGGLMGGQAAFGDERSRALVPIGATLLGVGVVALAIGLPLWLGNRTQVTLASPRAEEAKIADR